MFTRTGWKFINSKPEEIHVFDLKDYAAKFEKVTWNEFDYEGDMYKFNGARVNQFVTPEHKVPHILPYGYSLIIGLQQAVHLHERQINSILTNCNYLDFLPAMSQVVKNWKGKVYCPTTSTQLFVIRRHGKIFYYRK